MRASFHGVLGIVGLALLSLGAGAESLKVYDNFDSNQIVPNKWSRETMDRRAEIASGTLRMVQRDWGNTSGDTGSEARSHSMSTSNGQLVTQIKGTVRVAGYELVGCSAGGSAASEGRARMLGVFFNTGNRISGSNVGDMLAQIQVVRASNSGAGANVFDVRGSLFLCGDESCVNGTGMGSASLGTVSLNDTVALQMEWDKPGKRFVFMRDGGAFTGEVAYTQSDTNYPGAPFMAVGTRTVVANCTQSPRPRVMMDARFDQVQVNQSAVR